MRLSHTCMSLLFLQCLLTLEYAVAAAELVACDNFITRNIPGGMQAVNRAAERHRGWLNNASAHKKYTDVKWKFEFIRNLDKINLPQCSDFRTFGKAYDEMKMFCSPPEQRKNCNVYSLGSHNQWEFEEQMHKDTECSISTFDCTVDGMIPPAIKDRTTFYKKCVGNPNTTMNGMPLVRMTDLKSVTGVDRIDYLKIDIEGYEWVLLRDMINAVKSDPAAERGLPLQLFIEFHLDRSPEQNRNYVGSRLRKFFGELFEIGYMLMFTRPTVQSRNTDGLLVKVLCNPENVV